MGKSGHHWAVGLQGLQMAELLHYDSKNCWYAPKATKWGVICPLCTKLVTSFKWTKCERHAFSTNFQAKTTPEYITLHAMCPENTLHFLYWQYLGGRLLLAHRYFKIKERSTEHLKLKFLTLARSKLFICSWNAAGLFKAVRRTGIISGVEIEVLIFQSNVRVHYVHVPS